MDILDTLQVYSEPKGSMELFLASTYIYWDDSVKLRGFHLESLSGIQYKQRDLTMVFFAKSTFKCYKFTPLVSCDAFISKVISLVFPVPKHFLIIFNQFSGSKKSASVLENDLLPLLSYTPYSFEVHESQKNGLSPQVLDKIGKSITDIICLSGDGTVHLVITAIFNRDPGLLTQVGLAVLPTGSRNSLSFELNGRSLKEVIFNIIRGKHVVGDLMKVTLGDIQMVCTTAVAWGISANITNEAENYRKLGMARYIIIGLKIALLKWRNFFASLSYLDINDEKHEVTGEFLGILVGNHRAKNIHNDECPFPLARISSGCMDLMIADAAGRFNAIHYFTQIMNNGAHLQNPIVSYVHIKKCKIIAQDDFVLNVDGEVYMSQSIEVEILPKSIKFYANPMLIN